MRIVVTVSNPHWLFLQQIANILNIELEDLIVDKLNYILIHRILRTNMELNIIYWKH